MKIKYAYILNFRYIIGKIDCATNLSSFHSLFFCILYLLRFLIYSPTRFDFLISHVEEDNSRITQSTIFSEWKMSLTNQMFDCIKTNNLTKEELDRITDDVSKALIDPKGNELFESYLSQFKFSDGLASLRLYNTCSKILNEKHNRA